MVATLTKKELKEIFSSIELDSIRHHFQEVNSHYFDEVIGLNYFKEELSLEISFRLQGKFFSKVFSSNGFSIGDLNIKEAIFWLDEETEYILNDQELHELEEVLRQKINEII